MKSNLIGILVSIMLFIPVISAIESSGISNSDSGISALTIQSDVVIKLLPHNAPIVIQAAGGNFDYNIDVTNNEAVPSSFDVWTKVILPDGTPYGSGFGPVNFLLPAGWSGNSDMTQNIPAEAPSGNYTYTAYVGNYPDDVWNSDSFYFEKLPDAGGWYAQISGTSRSVFLTDVHFIDANNGWAVGTRNTIIHTTDGGDNWYPQTSPPNVNYNSVFFTDANNGWAVGGGKIVHTTDGGLNWNYKSSSSYLYDVYFADVNNGWIVGGYGATFSAPPKRFILHTTDGGNTWSTQLYQSSKFPLHSVDFVDSAKGCTVGELGAILCTSNGGNKWIEQNSGTSQNLNGVTLVDASTAWIAGNSGTILHTTNGGSNWIAQNSGTSQNLNSVTFTDASKGWVAGGTSNTVNIILHTSDGGSNWHTQNSSVAPFLSSIFFTDANTGWATGNLGTIVHTTTGGE